MSPFPTINLVAWIFVVCIATSTSDNVRRELTSDKVEVHYNSHEDFPMTLPVILTNTKRTVKFNFTKRPIDYNLPVYTRTQNKKGYVIIDTPPIKGAALYADDKYDASITLHCEENDPFTDLPTLCSRQWISGYFHLDGYKHVIEPKKRIFKRSAIPFNKSSRQSSVRTHQVFRIHPHEHGCCVADDVKFVKKVLPENIIPGRKRVKRSSSEYIIEVLAVFTYSLPINPEEIKSQKMYYTHIFWGVNKIFNNIHWTDMNLGVNLVGFIMEPHNANFYVFPNGTNTKGYISAKETLSVLEKFKDSQSCDHLTLFSIYGIEKDPLMAGFSPVNGMCTNQSVSVIKAMGNFQEIFVLAHELGHNLGSRHDGHGQCVKDEGYIMSTNPIPKNPQHMLNRYMFSNCSLGTISKLINVAKSCLQSISLPSILPVIPTGQLYNLQQQCRARAGFKGTCPNVLYKNVSTLCLAVWCDAGNYSCVSFPTAYKTTCGNRKWCVFGHCVYDILAPLADESCLFGDEDKPSVDLYFSNGTIYVPKNCDELTRLSPEFCVASRYKKRCCDTCFNLAHPGNRYTTPSLLSSTVSDSATSLRFNYYVYPISWAILCLFQLKNYLVS